jgi:hypothetical protein
MLNFGLPAPFSHRTSQAHVARSSADSVRMFAVASYDPETLRVVSDAFDEAWKEYRALLPVEPVDAAATRSAMARRIMAAIDEGRRDSDQLKWIALRA